MDAPPPPYYSNEQLTLYAGNALDVLRTLPSGSVDCAISSPPYFSLRDYGAKAQIGLERTPAAYVRRLVEVFRELRRVLADDGVFWLNIGDSYTRNPAKGQHKPGDTGKQQYVYERGGGQASTNFDFRSAGLKEKDLIGIPWRLALALQQPWLACPSCARESHGSDWGLLADGTRICPDCRAFVGPETPASVSEPGWYLRSDVIWHKPNALPNSVKDRPVTDHEYVFLLAKSKRYHFDAAAISEIGANGAKRAKRTVWSIPTRPYKGAHFAVFPPTLVEPMLLSGCPLGGTVLDPFFGAGTTGVVAISHGRHVIGIELNPDYCAIAKKRLTQSLA